MKKYLLILPVLAVFLLPHFTRAATIAELQALIKQLQAQIQSLQAQIADQSQGQAQWCHDFNVNLKFGDKGDDVASLQTALEKEGFTISENEANRSYFGESTASAVSGFQEKYKDEVLTPAGLKYGTGFVGRLTRAKLNSLYGCGKIVVQPPTIPPSLSSSPEPKQSTTTPSITVLSPNGGEVWRIGGTYSIQWKSSNLPSNSGGINIDLINYSGSGSGRIASGISISSNSYNWTIPPSQLAGENAYKIAISVSPPPGQGGPSLANDESNAPFSIVSSQPQTGTVNVVTRVGGQVTYDVRNCLVSIQGPSYENTVSCSTTLTNQSPGTYLLKWISGYPAGADTSLSPKFTSSYTLSSGGSITFYVDFQAQAAQSPSITVLSPAGGEQWNVGSTRTISWQTINAPAGSWVGRVALYKGASFLIDLVPFLSQSPSTGSVNWNIPSNSVLGNDFRIQVILYSGTPGNESVIGQAWSNYFSIVSARPILSMALDSSSPSGYVVAGSVNVPLFAVQFKTGSNEARFNLTVTDIGSSAGSGNLSNVRLYDGAMLLANGYRVSEGAYDSYTFNNTIILAANTVKTFVVKADIASNATGSVKLRVSGISHNYGTSLDLQGEAEGYSLSIISSRGAAPAPNYLASIQAQLNAITLELQKILEKLR